MTTLTEIPPSRKPPKAFYAILHDVSSSLAKVNGDVLFFDPETSTITTVTSYAGLTVLDEIGLADTQQPMDQFHSGYVAIACSCAN